MKSLTDFLVEGNISNTERQYREFVEMCRAHKVEPDEIAVQETSLHNWKVLKDGKKIFLASKYILNDEVIEKFNIKKA